MCLLYTMSYQQKDVENLDKSGGQVMVIHRIAVQIVETQIQYFVRYRSTYFMCEYAQNAGWKVLDEKGTVPYNKQEYSHVCVISPETASGRS